MYSVSGSGAMGGMVSVRESWMGAGLGPMWSLMGLE